MRLSFRICLLFSVLTVETCFCIDIVASTRNEIRTALATANPGDRILIAPGVYSAGFFQAGLRRVTITSQDPSNPAVLRGGTNAIQIDDSHDVTISNIVCEGQSGNGINISDGGSFESPTTDVLIENVIVRNVAGRGNLDGIKLSGVTGFTIRNVQVSNWGDDGSAVDPTGSHNGLVENSIFRQDSGGFSSAIRPKGGSKNIIVRANRLELGSTETALQAGGTTETQFFRFIDGDSGYEANNVTFEGNVVVGCRAAFVFEDIDGGLFHHNYVLRPRQFMVRYLPGSNPFSTVITQNGRVEDNVLLFRDTVDEYSRALNIGPNVMENTLRFRRNTWVNLANRGDSEPDLPNGDVGGVFGIQPGFDHNSAIPHGFVWGVWCVNAVQSSNRCQLPSGVTLERAFPRRGARFNPLLSNPFIGRWRFRRFTRRRIRMNSMTQQYFRII